MSALDVLFEDNHLLVVNKPAGIATMGAESGPTIHSMAADHLKRKYNKPGKAFVGIVSRLDTMTSGVIVLARTSKAASRLSQQFAGKPTGLAKVYLAAVSPPIDVDHGQWTDWVRKDDRARRMRVVDRSTSGAQQASLQFQRVANTASHSILAVRLLTGRKHQIRVQCADRGHPIVGDRKYDCPRRFAAGIALHSWRLQIVHPTRRHRMWFAADPPSAWRPFQSQLADSDQLWKVTRDAFGLGDPQESQ